MNSLAFHEGLLLRSELALDLGSYTAAARVLAIASDLGAYHEHEFLP